MGGVHDKDGNVTLGKYVLLHHGFLRNVHCNYNLILKMNLEK